MYNLEEDSNMLKRIFLLFLVVNVLSACSLGAQKTQTEKEYKIGILLSDSGLGDESFNDSAFRGLERARDEFGILFDYKEAPDGDFEEKLTELVAEEYDLIIGLGFSVKEALEEVAKEHPNQQFMIIDEVSELENVVSLTFKEYEGSFLVGMVAAMKSTTGKIGFIGGFDVPVVNHFKAGYIQGAKYINPNVEVLVEYANSFGDATLGGTIAEKQIAAGADFIYPAAGFTGFGALQTAQKLGKLAAGVDSDQFFVAEKAVTTSMLKNIDVAVYDIAKELKDTGKIGSSAYVLGLSENGVGLADIRVVQLSDAEKSQLKEAKEKIISGDITVPME